MSEYVSRCYKCLAPNPAWGSTICAACRQIESNERSFAAARDAAEENAQMMAEQARANARMQADMQAELQAQTYAQNERNATLARQQARTNARLTAEGMVSYDDAYQYGLHYLEGRIGTHMLFGSVTNDVTLSLDLTGTIDCYRALGFDPYQMEHLNQAFDRGLAQCMKNSDIQHPGADFILENVYNAGRELRTEFCISYKVNIAGVIRELRTDTFETNFNRQLVMETGEYEYFYDYPFNLHNEHLNTEFVRGMNEKIAELDENTPEKMQHRLETEVADILVERAAQALQQQENLAAQTRQQQENLAAQIKEAKSEINGGNIAVFATVAMVIGTIALTVMLWNDNRGFLAIGSVIVGVWATVGLWANVFSGMYDTATYATSRLESLEKNRI